MDKLLIVGGGGFGRIVHEHCYHLYETAFIDDNLNKGIIINGCKVIGNVENLAELYGEYRRLIIAIGNNHLREEIYVKAKEIGYTFPNVILDSVYISPFARIGDGCILLNNVVVQNNAKVGNGVILNSGVEIHNDTQIGNYVLVYSNTVIRTLSKIGDRVKIGSTSTICNNVMIENDTIIDDGEIVK